MEFWTFVFLEMAIPESIPVEADKNRIIEKLIMAENGFTILILMLETVVNHKPIS